MDNNNVQCVPEKLNKKKCSVVEHTDFHFEWPLLLLLLLPMVRRLFSVIGSI